MKNLPILLLLELTIVAVIGSESFAQSPGDTIGQTQYGYQSNGSTGRRVACDDQGYRQFIWTYAEPYPGLRWVRYACLDPDNNLIQGPVSYRNGTGFAQISLMSDSRAVCVYHQSTANAESLFCAIDQFRCLDAFDTRHPPNRIGANKLLWPFVSIDHNDRVQLVATTSTNGLAYTYAPMGYTRSNNGGTTWVSITAVDTVRTVSPIIVASKVSDKVAIVYNHPTDSTSARNNVYYIESADGITWNNFTPKINITGYGTNGDSLYAWNEVSAVYDYNDNLHIIWSAQYVSGSPGSAPRLIVPGTRLYHWVSNTNVISIVDRYDTTWPESGCNFEDGSFIYSQYSIAVDLANLLIIAYTSWDSTDCSAAGYANGDIYLQASNNYGSTWTPKMNVTNSRTPGCASGGCASDIFPSLAEKISFGPYAHIFYVCDRSGGGEVTDYPLLYIKVLAESIDDIPALPAGFALSQNYPNPFNAQTSISFTLPYRCSVNLSIYDILGRKQTILIDGVQEAGQHQVIWDASNFASGVYYARLQTEQVSQNVKMVVLK